MKSIRSSMLLKMLVLSIAALGVSAGSAHAQSTAGKFTLPHEARWGSVLLAPGPYTFSLRSSSLPAVIMVASAGSPKVAIVLPWVVSTEKLTDSSKLVLAHDASGESFVSALYLGELGMSLHYAPPKAQAAAETAKLGPIADARPGK
jgi:hypothetical protein